MVVYLPGERRDARQGAPPWRQPRCKSMVSLVNSHTNATRIGWHLWEIDLRFVPGLPPGWRQLRPVERGCGTEAGAYLRPIDSCITQLKVQGPSRTCNESKEEEEKAASFSRAGAARHGGGARHVAVGQNLAIGRAGVWGPDMPVRSCAVAACACWAPLATAHAGRSAASSAQPAAHDVKSLAISISGVAKCTALCTLRRQSGQQRGKGVRGNAARACAPGHGP